ncbi:hypothetical protein ABIA31_002086, partial [Catenulispora sp. MAP5-51]
PTRPALRGMTAITMTGTSNTASSAPLDVQPFPARRAHPGRYYDLC